RASLDWPQARDQALCFGWIDGVRRSGGDETYTIRFTPRRVGSIWSKVNVERFEALKSAGPMTRLGEDDYERDRHRSGVCSYEKPAAELAPMEEMRFRTNQTAWSDWKKRPPGYRKTVLDWIARAKKPETRAKRLGELISVSAERRRLAQYDWRKKP
ncbi:MAG TPA: YdeI/OmpD-associated family protein, partial [Sphingomicrobium sp.]|nr:YdeI/OmpD-associated family protein [Sphingomicrobium sp.]